MADARHVIGCRVCEERWPRGCGGRHFRVDGYGFCERIVVAPNASAARWKDFWAQQEAGFVGRRDFRTYLNRQGSVSEVRP